jgi:enoyl-CoA hydratase/carnithine racemase
MTIATEITSGGEAPIALYERAGHLAIITFNRPRALNAMNTALSNAVGELLERARTDNDVRVVVITGAGRAFCAGADLKEIASGAVPPLDHPEWGFAGIVQHWLDKPLIGAVNGYAMGGGTEIVLACDLVVAAQDATLGLPEVKRGLFAAGGGVVRLQRQIPIKRALQLVLTGEAINAQTALSWGLVNFVSPPGAALERALELADQIAANAPKSVQISKHLVYQTAMNDSDSAAVPQESVWAANEKAMDAVFSSADAHEGATAFAEKRAPVWSGK